MPLLRIDDITDGMVARPFTTDDGTGRLKTLMPGTPLTHEQIRRIPLANRAALIDKGFISVIPKRVADSAAGSDRYVIHLGFGRYDVVEGRKLNHAPLNVEEAHEMAGLPPPAAKKSAKAK
jgi:hypothetical protein